MSRFEDVPRIVEALASDDIYLVGVRHHSPTLARALPTLLSRAEPDAVVLELPPEAADWVEWIAHPDAVAPLAFAVAAEGHVSFWPFADFSPELAALRWAQRHQVPVECGDISAVAHPATAECEADAPADAELSDPPGAVSVAQLLDEFVHAEHPDDAWDRLVEVPSTRAAPEAIRRAALAFGWSYRNGEMRSGGPDALTAAREAALRESIRRSQEKHGARIAAVTGAWHSPALTAPHIARTIADDRETLDRWVVGEGTSSLVAYAQPLLDSRSGYPSGIRDPQWQQTVLTYGHDAVQFERAVAGMLTEIGVGIRTKGHPCGPAEIAEAHRMALDLASLRKLPAPGRRELLEACTSVFAQGSVLGLGRVVASVAEIVLVGSEQGRLAKDTPRSGLSPAFIDDLAALRLPGPGETTKQVTLEPLRLNSDGDSLDTKREIFLHRSRVAGIAYAQQINVVGVGGALAVSTRWKLTFDASTEATLAKAGGFGVTLTQAAAGRLRSRRPEEDEHPELLVTGLYDAAHAGLMQEFDWWLTKAAALLPTRAGMKTLISAMETLANVQSGGVAGTLRMGDRRSKAVTETLRLLSDAAIAHVDGIKGSDDPSDARMLSSIAALRIDGLGLRLTQSFVSFTVDASPLMQGVATALLHRLEQLPPGTPGFSERVRSTTSPSGHSALRRWITGFIVAAPVQFNDDPVLLADLRKGVEDLDEAQFIARLPALRGGFDDLSSADRERILQALETEIATPARVPVEKLEQWSIEDKAAWERLQRLGLSSMELTPAQRWALVLGRRRQQLATPAQRRLARSLDQLYGNGSGEGSTPDALDGFGGSLPPFPTAREWADELDAFFGEEVRDDIAAEAVAAGNPLGLDLLVDAQPRASVELLNTVLSLSGALPESMIAKLRPLLKRMVAELSAALADQLRPALRGLSGLRPSTKPSARLDAQSTIRRNLHHVVMEQHGHPKLVVATPVFRQPVARRSEWHVIIAVDVSGSMEPSTVFAALTAAILAGTDALSVTFLAFSTQVIDLTDQVDDPLALLLEVQVGGGTDIAGALRVAQDRVRVPSRTMLVVISDFDEGGPTSDLLAQVESLHNAGARLLGCAALDDTGQARYNAAIAGQVAAAGMSVSAVSPTALARWVAEQVNR